MSSPPWEPQRPPSGPAPGWQQPNAYRPAAGPGNPPPWPRPQWPAGGQPPPYGPPTAAGYGGFGAPPPGRRMRSKTGWLIAIGVVAAIGLVSVVLILVVGGGARDEKSYQAGRSAAQTGGAGVLIKFGGMTRPIGIPVSRSSSRKISLARGGSCSDSHCLRAVAARESSLAWLRNIRDMGPCAQLGGIAV